MSGRPAKKCYEYTPKGDFVKEFPSESEATRNYYSTMKGKRALFKYSNGGGYSYDRNYHILPNDNVIVKERLGRNKVKSLLKRLASPYVDVAKTEKEVEVYNLDNQVVATFKSAYIAAKMTNVAQATIHHQLNNKKNGGRKTDLLFKYKI